MHQCDRCGRADKPYYYYYITNWLTIYLKARSWSNIDRAFQDLMFAITSKFSLIFLPIILGISD